VRDTWVQIIIFTK